MRRERLVSLPQNEACSKYKPSLWVVITKQLTYTYEAWMKF